MPRTVVISKLNHPRADYDARAAAGADASSGTRSLPLYVPVPHNGSDIDDLAALLSQTVSDYSDRRLRSRRCGHRATTSRRSSKSIAGR